MAGRSGRCKGLIGYAARAAARLRPDAMLIGFDCPDHSVRKDDYPGYKAHRPDKPADLVEQLLAAPGAASGGRARHGGASRVRGRRHTRQRRRARPPPRLAVGRHDQRPGRVRPHRRHHLGAPGAQRWPRRGGPGDRGLIGRGLWRAPVAVPGLRRPARRPVGQPARRAWVRLGHRRPAARRVRHPRGRLDGPGQRRRTYGTDGGRRGREPAPCHDGDAGDRRPQPSPDADAHRPAHA